MIAITGGGTGGHLVIAKAIKEELNQRGIKAIYIGSNSGQDKAWFEHDEGFEQKYFLESRGVVNKKGIQKLLSLMTIVRSSFTCKALFKKHNIHAVFSVGGYSAAPASLGALLSRLPLYIHEQNAIQGKLNTLLRPFSKAFFSAYDTSATLTSYPVSESFFKYKRERTHLKTIIFLGGSQGATFINQLALKMAKILHENNIAIMHQTGNKEFEAIQKFYETEKIPADVFAFTTNMAQKLKEADFAISRSGASTLWELCATALPALFIPYPHAAANHQYYNAKTLEEKGLALLLQQNTIDEKILFEKIKYLDLKKMSHELSTLIRVNGSKEIVNHILKESTC
ncbi:undecaprenyldiphospho-muramoylpentapeptide beta-N-acetylglucosaminyltransferase [Sulfurospirillum barnesii]|uniref:UDP-N-acetylglucosamine--N-acetylmuramyl-(pentapeptide) pyrophosphoryl-undecaprenol N-acetylglucosamine transferase n=1 Tax=Sulfurospirillum barnesii (strain ATCC 700032 / DSM 10660 / SES-3) TaxID=760154 RepID=I3XYK7_SULBS|nr:undecaprenyldiphospho-muramoylpentapeptide beta-N-acetylglucosaminyltransferase [Sulfurospirillum barnesii]AFL69031.1 UDP-N-acetylglucosamine--N-acetylmuramyl-(pentapeptide) pyrophosphoryl-undecaprenol N-acetylglucosamine transferase [Sulfurospirillum barnesii SES-3]